MRLAPIGQAGTLLDFSGSVDSPAFAVGTTLFAKPTSRDTTTNMANWCVSEVVYVGFSGAAAAIPGTVMTLDHQGNAAISAAAASLVNLGKPVYIALTSFAIGSTTKQYGWVLASGICPAVFSVAATTGKVFAGTAGALTPTAAAGGQILNAQTLIAAVTTFTKSGTTRTGSSNVRFAGTMGMYPGQAISGTGIPASSVVSSIDANGLDVAIGSAIGTLVTATASATVTVTFTNTSYGIIHVSRPFVQGQIT